MKCPNCNCELEVKIKIDTELLELNKVQDKPKEKILGALFG